jgi:hypothetical protein
MRVNTVELPRKYRGSAVKGTSAENRGRAALQRRVKSKSMRASLRTQLTRLSKIKPACPRTPPGQGITES